MGRCKVLSAQVLLGTSNLLLMATSVGLLICGYYLLLDENKILLSMLVTTSVDYNGPLSALSQPLFFYVAVGITFAGIIVFISATIGFWAVCANTYCVLVLYFLIVICLLLVQFSISLMATIWPQCLGLTLNKTSMIKTLQGLYGVPGEEFYSAALDLAQVRFGCCGINTSYDYLESMWQQQGLARKELLVPLTCCVLENPQEKYSHLDPVPLNTTLCELPQDSFKFRNPKGCLEDVEQWYRDHYLFFLTIVCTMVCIEFLVILNIIYSCARLQKKSRAHSETVAAKRIIENELQIYAIPKKPTRTSQRNTDSSEVYLNPSNKLSKNHASNQMYKPEEEFDSQGNRSYLV